MKAITCEKCGGNEVQLKNGYYVCAHCGTRYIADHKESSSGRAHVDYSEENKKLDRSRKWQGSLPVPDYYERWRNPANKSISLPKRLFIIFSALVIIYGVISFIKAYWNNPKSSSHSSSYSYSATSTPAIPSRPPVNLEHALTKEEADALSGTGYHGTRPNSSAEDIELKAAMVKCKNCGYRSHNGANSLCDYCRWMEKYGGGLP